MHVLMHIALMPELRRNAGAVLKFDGMCRGNARLSASVHCAVYSWFNWRIRPIIFV